VRTAWQRLPHNRWELLGRDYHITGKNCLALLCGSLCQAFLICYVVVSAKQFSPVMWLSLPSISHLLCGSLCQAFLTCSVNCWDNPKLQQTFIKMTHLLFRSSIRDFCVTTESISTIQADTFVWKFCTK
jgi:Cdc6-like AAA superfamily ATPase